MEFAAIAACAAGVAAVLAEAAYGQLADTVGTVQLKDGASATEDELMAFCREHLPRFAVPRTVVFGPLPTTATGKIQKYTLRERAREF